MKKLSIIIVNYNSTEFLEKCLESFDQSFPKEWEIIIIDNGSREKFQAQGIKGSRDQIIRNEKNVGFAKANNQGIKESDGEYILLLNPDTILSQQTLQAMLEFMDKQPKAGVATCKVMLPNGKIDDASHRGFPTPWRAFCYFSGLASLFPNSRIFNGYHLGYQNMDQEHEIEACVGAFMLIRREAGEEARWLDEDYFWYGEDLDFCYRLKQEGWQVWYVPTVSILHYKGVTSGIKEHSQEFSTASKETKRNAQIARFEAMRIFYNKHYKNKYPEFVTSLVNTGISILEKWYM